MNSIHKAVQSCNRRLNRSGTRMLAAGRRRPPNHLVHALAAFRAHRRLMKLAPHRFDYGIVRQNTLQREAAIKNWAKWEAAIIKVYGDDPAAISKPGCLHT